MNKEFHAKMKKYAILMLLTYGVTIGGIVEAHAIPTKDLDENTNKTVMERLLQETKATFR